MQRFIKFDFPSLRGECFSPAALFYFLPPPTPLALCLQAARSMWLCCMAFAGQLRDTQESRWEAEYAVPDLALRCCVTWLQAANNSGPVSSAHKENPGPLTGAHRPGSVSTQLTTAECWSPLHHCHHQERSLHPTLSILLGSGNTLLLWEAVEQIGLGCLFPTLSPLSPRSFWNFLKSPSKV